MSHENEAILSKQTDNHTQIYSYGTWMTTFSTNPYFIFQRLECYTTLIVKKLLYNKNQIFTSISKSVVTYINITVTNISNNIIKQYYGIMKTFKFLVIVKKKLLSRTNIPI